MPVPATHAVQDAIELERVVAKSSDAMLMGLGDVIFPGMLVLSTLQYVGGDNGFALFTLIGVATKVGSSRGILASSLSSSAL